ncbi:sensor histidine kinase [Fusibacter sp. JL298sf-3]
MTKDLLGTIVGTTFEHITLVYVLCRLLKIGRHKWLLLFVMALLWNVFSIAIVFTIPVYAPFIIFPVLIVCVTYISQESFFKVFFTFLGFAFLMIVIQLPLVPIYHYMGNSLEALLGISIFVLLAVALILYRWEEILIYHIEKYENKYINYLALNLVLFGFLYKIIHEYDKSILAENFLYLGFLLVLMLVLNYFIYKEVAHISERNKLLEVQEQIREPMGQLMDEVRSKQHEYKNHLNTILGILETSSTEAAVGSVKSYMSSIETHEAFDAAIIAADRDILKAILHVKRNEAYSKAIDFSVVIKNDLSQLDMLDYELSIVLNNLLNNAFEAVLQEGNPTVVFESGYDERANKHYVLTKNACSKVPFGEVIKFTDKRYSTKDGGKRGYGLYNVKRIAAKRGGGVELYFEDEMLVVRVLL